jgi:AbrB family looped-hinge helix DNA binding protein
MNRIATTKMSSKGQVVIPEEVRNALGLEPGSQFVVVGEGDVVVLKKVTPPSMSDFDAILEEARRQARQAGMKRADIAAAIRAARPKRSR